MIDAIEGMSAGAVPAAPAGDGAADATDRGVAGAARGEAGGGNRVRSTQAKRSSG